MIIYFKLIVYYFYHAGAEANNENKYEHLPKLVQERIEANKDKLKGIDEAIQQTILREVEQISVQTLTHTRTRTRTHIHISYNTTN